MINVTLLCNSEAKFPIKKVILFLLLLLPLHHEINQVVVNNIILIVAVSLDQITLIQRYTLAVREMQRRGLCTLIS